MKKTILANGLTIITEEFPTSKSASLNMFVGAGSYQEKGFPYGIAHFIEHMLFKGTKSRTVFEINEEIDEIGGILNAYTTYEQTKYYTLVPFNQWKKGMDVLLDLIWNHTIPEDEIGKERNVILEEIKMYEDDPGSLTMDVLVEAMFDNAKERQTILGTEESLLKITIDDIKRFIEKYYQPDNLTFVAVGNIKHDEIVSFISNYGFTRNGRSAKEKVEFKPIVLENEMISLTKDVQQAHFSFGMFAPSIKHTDYYTCKVLADLLGGSSSSRLYRLIREERGLAYTVDLGFEAVSDIGVFQGYVGLEGDKLEEVKEIVREEFKKLQSELVGEKELNRAINHASGLFMLSLEDNEALSDFLGRNNQHGLSFDPDEYIKRLKEVTSEDIIRVANTYFNDDNWIFVELIPEE